MNVKPAGASTGTQAWPDLNMFDHVVTDEEMTADKFERVRQAYCEYLVRTEDKVEDAITSNSLQIKDQLIFMVAQTVHDGCNPPAYMTVGEVPALVEMLLEESPRRLHGTHTAQPVLCRAGPGTGKTWMIKQAFFLNAERLRGECSADLGGLPLVPVIVFVQRIVRLLRELGDDPSALLQDPNGLMRWFVR